MSSTGRATAAQLANRKIKAAKPHRRPLNASASPQPPPQALPAIGDGSAFSFSAPPVNNPFSNSSASPNPISNTGFSGSIFNIPLVATQQPLFGQQPSAQGQPGVGLFNTPSAPAAGNGGLFGATNAFKPFGSEQPKTDGPFSQASTPAPASAPSNNNNLFGSSIFQAPTTSPLFSPAKSQPPTTSGIFGITPTQPALPPNVFGSLAKPSVTSANASGSDSPATALPASGLFGSAVVNPTLGRPSDTSNLNGTSGSLSIPKAMAEEDLDTSMQSNSPDSSPQPKASIQNNISPPKTNPFVGLFVPSEPVATSPTKSAPTAPPKTNLFGSIKMPQPIPESQASPELPTQASTPSTSQLFPAVPPVVKSPAAPEPPAKAVSPPALTDVTETAKPDTRTEVDTSRDETFAQFTQSQREISNTLRELFNLEQDFKSHIVAATIGQNLEPYTEYYLKKRAEAKSRIERLLNSMPDSGSIGKAGGASSAATAGNSSSLPRAASAVEGQKPKGKVAKPREEPRNLMGLSSTPGPSKRKAFDGHEGPRSLGPASEPAGTSKRKAVDGHEKDRSLAPATPTPVETQRKVAPGGGRLIKPLRGTPGTQKESKTANIFATMLDEVKPVSAPASDPQVHQSNGFGLSKGITNGSAATAKPATGAPETQGSAVAGGSLFDRVSNDPNDTRPLPQGNAENGVSATPSKSSNLFGFPSGNTPGNASVFASSASPSLPPASAAKSASIFSAPSTGNAIGSGLFGSTPAPVSTSTTSGKPTSVFDLPPINGTSGFAFGSSTSPSSDNTWKPDTPIKFNGGEGTSVFQTNGAKPSATPSKPLTGLFGAAGAPGSSTPAASPSKPAQVGFGFGTPPASSFSGLSAKATAQAPAAATTATTASPAEAPVGFKPSAGALGFKPSVAAGGSTDFMAQFKSVAAKTAEQEKAKRKAEEFDSDEDDEAEWERKDAEKQRAKQQKIEEAAKSSVAKYVPGKGFAFVPSQDSSRATSPGATTDTGAESVAESVTDAQGSEVEKTNTAAKGPEGADGEAEGKAKFDLSSRGPGEEDEDQLFEVRAKALLYDGTKKDWQSQGVGPLRVLKHRDTNKVRILMRQDPRGTIVLNAALLKAVTYEAKGNGVVQLASASEGGKLDSWMIKVKRNDDAVLLAELLEKEKH